MKLILCPLCQDVVRLRSELRRCECGTCWGRYLDDLKAEISEKAIPLGFNNTALRNAVMNQPQKGQGKGFGAFVIPKECSTVKVVKRDA